MKVLSQVLLELQQRLPPRGQMKCCTAYKNLQCLSHASVAAERATCKSSRCWAGRNFVPWAQRSAALRIPPLFDILVSGSGRGLLHWSTFCRYMNYAIIHSFSGLEVSVSSMGGLNWQLEFLGVSPHAMVFRWSVMLLAVDQDLNR